MQGGHLQVTIGIKIFEVSDIIGCRYVGEGWVAITKACSQTIVKPGIYQSPDSCDDVGDGHGEDDHLGGVDQLASLVTRRGGRARGRRPATHWTEK